VTLAACCCFLNGRLAPQYIRHVLSQRDAYKKQKNKPRPENNLIVESSYTQDIYRGLARKMVIFCSCTCWECLALGSLIKHYLLTVLDILHITGKLFSNIKHSNFPYNHTFCIVDQESHQPSLLIIVFHCSLIFTSLQRTHITKKASSFCYNCRYNINADDG
jgi:hypothetical protein